MADLIAIDLWSGDQINLGPERIWDKKWKYIVRTEQFQPATGRKAYQNELATESEIIHYFQYSSKGTPLKEQAPGRPGLGMTGAQRSHFLPQNSMPYSIPSNNPKLVEALTTVGALLEPGSMKEHREYPQGIPLTTNNINRHIESIYEKDWIGKVGEYFGSGTSEGLNVSFRNNAVATNDQIEKAYQAGDDELGDSFHMKQYTFKILLKPF